MTGIPLDVRVVCAICGAPDPQATAGCDGPGCAWRAEAVGEVLRDGAAFRARCDGTNNSAADRAEGRLNVAIEVWPGARGHA